MDHSIVYEFMLNTILDWESIVILPSRLVLTVSNVYTLLLFDKIKIVYSAWIYSLSYYFKHNYRTKVSKNYICLLIWYHLFLGNYILSDKRYVAIVQRPSYKKKKSCFFFYKGTLCSWIEETVLVITW